MTPLIPTGLYVDGQVNLPFIPVPTHCVRVSVEVEVPLTIRGYTSLNKMVGSVHSNELGSRTTVTTCPSVGYNTPIGHYTTVTQMVMCQRVD